jgi:hypothetical protein
MIGWFWPKHSEVEADCEVEIKPQSAQPARVRLLEESP